MPKQKNNSISFPVRIDYEQKVEPGSTTNGSKTGTASYVRTRSGANCPDFAGKIARGENATTALTGTFDSGYHSRADGLIASDYIFMPPQKVTKTFTKSDMCFLANNLASARGPRTPTMDTSATISAAAAQFYGKLRATQVAMSGMTVLGEAGESYRMLRTPLAALQTGAVDFLEEVRRLKRRTPKQWGKALAGLWLEASFGWSPLIKDAQDAVKTLRELNKERSQKVSAGASRKEDKTSSLPPHDRAIQYAEVLNTRWNSTATLYETVTVRFRAGLRAQAELPMWGNTAALFGFKPEEFIPTAWNLLPWSFLADYVTNLGDMIEANATDTSRVAWVSRTIIQESTYRGQVYCVISESGQTPKANYQTGGDVSPSGWSFKRRVVNRAPAVHLPIVTFQVDTGLSFGQKLNVLALLGQANEIHHQDFRWRRSGH